MYACPFRRPERLPIGIVRHGDDEFRRLDERLQFRCLAIATVQILAVERENRAFCFRRVDEELVASTLNEPENLLYVPCSFLLAPFGISRVIYAELHTAERRYTPFAVRSDSGVELPERVTTQLGRYRLAGAAYGELQHAGIVDDEQALPIPAEREIVDFANVRFGDGLRRPRRCE